MANAQPIRYAGLALFLTMALSVVVFAAPSVAAPVTSIGAASSTNAANTNSATTYTENTFYYETINFRGNDQVSTAQLNSIAAPFLGRPISLQDLQTLADQLTDAIITEGYFLSRALIPSQDLSGTSLTIQVSEGYISQVRFADEKNKTLSPVFAQTLQERPAQFATYQRALLKLNAMPGIRVKEYRQSKDPDHADAYIVDLKITTAKYALTANLSNRGQRNGEAVKSYLGLDLNSLLRKGDTLRTGFITKPSALDEFQSISARYDIPALKRPYTFFAQASHSKTSPRSALAGRNLAGETIRLGLGVQRTLVRDLRRRMWVEARLDIVDAKEEEDLSRLYNDKLRVIRVSSGLTHLSKKNALTNIFIEASHGLDAFNASTRIGAQASRLDANAQFTKILADLRYRRPITKNLRLTLGGVGQYSDNPLLFSEEFSLGGGTYGRGYDFGEILGDSGAAGFVELGYNRSGTGLLKDWEAYGFVDSGTVWNKGDGLSIDGDFLTSAGLGLRMNLANNLRLSYEAANPITDAPFTLQDYFVRHRLDVTFTRSK